MEQLGFFLIVCFMASAFVQTVRRVPHRRLQRRSLWLTAGTLGLQRQQMGVNRLYFAGDVDDMHVSVRDGIPDDPTSSAVQISIEAPVLSFFSIELNANEWGAGEWIGSQICLWPVAQQRLLRSMLRHDCSFFVRQGAVVLIDPSCGHSADAIIDLIDDTLCLVTELSELFPNAEAVCSAVVELLDDLAADEVEETIAALPTLACGVDFLLEHGTTASVSESVCRCLQLLLSFERGVPKSLVSLWSKALDGPLLEEDAKAALLDVAFAHPSPAVQMLGARYAGTRGYLCLHAIASNDEMPGEQRIDALRHLMAMYPHREVALRGLLRRALSSNNRRLQQVAIEAVIRRECQGRGRKHPDTYVFLDSLFRILQWSTPEQIDELAKSLYLLVDRPFPSWQADWLMLPPLVALLQQRTRSTLLPMIRLLKRWRLPAAEPLLLGWLSHPSEEVRIHSLRALGACGTSASLSAIRRFTRRFWMSHQLKKAAGRALVQLEARLAEEEVGRLSLCGPIPHRGSLSYADGSGALSLSGDESALDAVLGGLIAPVIRSAPPFRLLRMSMLSAGLSRTKHKEVAGLMTAWQRRLIAKLPPVGERP